MATPHSALPAFRAGQRDTVTGMLARAVASHASREFLVIDRQPVCYEEVDHLSNAMAHELQKLGVHYGDRVVTLFDTCLDVFTCWFAINKLGAVWVPINTAYRGDFLRHQVNDAGAKIAICGASYLERFVHIADSLPDLQLLLCTGDSGGASAPGFPVCAIPIKSLDAFRGTDISPPAVVVNPRDLSALLYTSGTTGPSKGCMISHNYLAAIAVANRRSILLDQFQTLWTCLPTFHAAALMAVLAVMIDGSRVAIASNFSVSRFWDDIENAGATSAMLMASIFQLVAQAPDCDAAKRYFGKLQMIFGVPITPAVRRIWKERFGVGIASSWAYGQTEGIRLTGVLPGETPPEDSAGRPIELFDMMIVDADDQPVPEGSVGEIVFRPREANVMFEGYWKRPEATAAAWRNMWMHTGDLGKMINGYLFFCDRAKDYLRSRGENISSFEVERAFMSHHAVAEVAAHAVGAQTGEDDLKVTVVLREGAVITEHDLCLWSLDNLPHFAVPRFIEFRPELPKNPTGRVLKFQLRDEGVTALTWDREVAGISVRRRPARAEA